MFIGHFGTGFAVKKFAPTVSLGTLFFAAQFIDLLWPVFLLFGIEHVKIDPGNTIVTPLNFIYYPFSHSLLAVLIWAIVFGMVYFLIKKNLKNAIWLGGLVLSHWILDLLTHRPDLPLIPGVQLMVGFSLWNSLWGTVVFEGLIFCVGVYFYLKVTHSKNKTGSIALWALIIFLIAIYIGNLFGSAPPSEEAIGWVGLTQWILIFWGYWVDRNRAWEK